MISGLLYLIGLISVLITIALAGYSAPAVISRFTAAMDAGNVNMIDLALSTLSQYNWALLPFVGGLALMGFGRIIMLLGSINRSLRGQN